MNQPRALRLAALEQKIAKLYALLDYREGRDPADLALPPALERALARELTRAQSVLTYLFDEAEAEADLARVAR